MIRGRREKPNSYLSVFPPDSFALHLYAIQFDNQLKLVWNAGAVL